MTVLPKEWRTVVALYSGVQWLKAMPKSFTFAFRLGLHFGLNLSFNSKNKGPKKRGALSQAKQRCSLSIWQESGREGRTDGERAQLRWKWNERETERPTERIRNNRNGRLRARVTTSTGAAPPAAAEAARLRRRRQPSSVLRYPRRLLGFSQSRYVVDVGRVFRIAIHRI